MMATDIAQRVRQIVAGKKPRKARQSELLQSEDRIVALVLRGHFLVEELLYSIVKAHCNEPKYLESAQLRFPQVVALVQSLMHVQIKPDILWKDLLELNSLRNNLAHRLSTSDRSRRLSSFVQHNTGKNYSFIGKDSLEAEAVVLESLVSLLERVNMRCDIDVFLQELITHQVSIPKNLKDLDFGDRDSQYKAKRNSKGNEN